MDLRLGLRGLIAAIAFNQLALNPLHLPSQSRLSLPGLHLRGVDLKTILHSELRSYWSTPG